MKVLLSWLQSWLPETPLDAGHLADRLTMAGLEVESVCPLAPPFSGVVVGQIVRAEPHPNAERLRLCTVEVGGEQPLAIVCGAPNARSGLKAPCALIGAQLPGGVKIGKAKLRGVESYGMLCSARELGISDEGGGLLELPADAPVGRDLRDYLQLDDVLLELKMTPNRADCLSILGLAREVAALMGGKLTPPWPAAAAGTPLSPEIDPVPAHLAAPQTVHLAAPEGCPRYLGRLIRGIDPTKPTPEWMVRRLSAAGVRPIHFIVDVTNYVMLELGQPLHAFDAAALHGGITVRWARAGETLTLLNGATVALDESVLVIADEAGPLALAGVMGGAESGVQPTTTAIFLESAFFAPNAIAGRARRFGLNSEAAHRFERGVDPEGCRRALERATALIQEVAGGTASEVIVAEAPEYLPCRRPIMVSQTQLSAHLGVAVTAAEAVQWLIREGIATTVAGTELTATPPSWRFDLTIAEDLAEELARLIGYDQLPAALPTVAAQPGTAPEERRSRHALRHFLCQRGYSEAVTFAFVPEAWERDVVGNAAPISLANPIAAPLAVLRSSLIPGLIEAVAGNRKRQAERVRLFEIGRCFLSAEPVRAVTQSELSAALARQQPLRLAAVAWGLAEEGWHEGGRTVDFYDVKGDLEALFAPESLTFSRIDHPALHPGRAATVWWRSQAIGVVGELHPRWARHWGLKPAPVLFEVDLAPLLERSKPSYRPLSRQPMVVRDLAFLVPQGVAVADLIEAVRRDAPQWLQAVWVFDCYQGSPLPEGTKSVALRLQWQHEERTLTDAEIDEAVAAAVARVSRQCGATLRQ